MNDYILKKSKRAKKLSITVRPDRTVTVTVPYRVSALCAEEFVRKKETWINRVLDRLDKRQHEMPRLPPASAGDYQIYKEKARAVAEDRLRHFNAVYRATWNRVTIKNTKTRWGSCSALRNLNFSYRLVFLPTHLQDYLVVHELCHLFEMNHSAKFWTLVERAVPSYVDARRELKNLP